MRKRTKINVAMVASSDISRMKIRNNILKENHNAFCVSSFNIPTDDNTKYEPKPDTPVKVPINGKYVFCTYKEVKLARYTKWLYV